MREWVTEPKAQRARQGKMEKSDTPSPRSGQANVVVVGVRELVTEPKALRARQDGNE